VLGGGTYPLVAGVKEIGVVAAAEAAEGEIIDTMSGAYLFAFSKKAFSSIIYTIRNFMKNTLNMVILN
jgi:hypothetical protein